jgi:hypothetical protein
LAKKLAEVTGDQNVNVRINVGTHQGVYFDDFILPRKIDIADYKVFKRDSTAFAAASLGHVLEEYYQADKQYSTLPDPYSSAHKDALAFEGKVMSDYTGHDEGVSKPVTKSGTVTSFVYNTVTYDVITKSATGEGANTMVRVVERQNKKQGTP